MLDQCYPAFWCVFNFSKKQERLKHTTILSYMQWVIWQALPTFWKKNFFFPECQMLDVQWMNRWFSRSALLRHAWASWSNVTHLTSCNQNLSDLNGPTTIAEEIRQHYVNISSLSVNYLQKRCDIYTYQKCDTTFPKSQRTKAKKRILLNRANHVTYIPMKYRFFHHLHRNCASSPTTTARFLMLLI